MYIALQTADSKSTPCTLTIHHTGVSSYKVHILAILSRQLADIQARSSQAQSSRHSHVHPISRAAENLQASDLLSLPLGLDLLGLKEQDGAVA